MGSPLHKEQLILRLATRPDLPALREVMALAIDHGQRDFLETAKVVASRGFMGLDTQLIDDGTYFLVETANRVIGCGGWSRRATLYGGDHSASLREPRQLDPKCEAARVRAMYTHPDFTRQGVGRLILSACEGAASEAGFGNVELMATLAGQPLYRACGYHEIEQTSARVDEVDVPLVRMGKRLSAATTHEATEGRASASEILVDR